MKREPFATVEEDPDNAAVRVWVKGRVITEYTDDVGLVIAERDCAILNDANAQAVRGAVAERDARIAELERVLKLAYEGILLKGGCFYQDKCQGESLCVPCKALAEIKSVLGKGE